MGALKANPHATQVTRDIGGVSMSTVVRIAHMAKVELTAGRKTMGRPLSPEQRRRLLEMRQQHPDATEIALAAMVGVSRSTVHRLAPREAGRKRTARGLSAAQRERVPGTAAAAAEGDRSRVGGAGGSEPVVGTPQCTGGGAASWTGGRIS